MRGFTKEADDDNNMPHHWLDYIQKYLDNAANASATGYRTQLVKVAALACAAIESYDRTNV